MRLDGLGKSVFFAATLLLMGLQGPTSSGHSIASVINECWKGHDHVGMSACVEARAKKAQGALSEAERAAGKAILASADEAPGFPEYRREATAKLHIVSIAFSKYVESECGYEASLSVKGNGPEDTRLACVAVLNEERVLLIRSVHPVP